jgi:hypothetical protein
MDHSVYKAERKRQSQDWLAALADSLKQVDKLSALTVNERERMVDAMGTVSFEAVCRLPRASRAGRADARLPGAQNATLWRAGEPCTWMGVITKGRALEESPVGSRVHAERDVVGSDALNAKEVRGRRRVQSVPSALRAEYAHWHPQGHHACGG